MNAVTTTSVTTRGGYSSVKSRQPQMQPQPQQMTDHHHTQRQMLPDQQHIQGYSSQQQQHLSNNTGELHNSMFECCSAKYESYQTDCFDASYKSALRVWLF